MFFIVILLGAISLGFHVLHLDKQNNNFLESPSNYQNEFDKNNSCVMSKSLMAKENGEGAGTDEEKRLLHLSRLI